MSLHLQNFLYISMTSYIYCLYTCIYATYTDELYGIMCVHIVWLLKYCVAYMCVCVCVYANKCDVHMIYGKRRETCVTVRVRFEYCRDRLCLNPRHRTRQRTCTWRGATPCGPRLLCLYYCAILVHKFVGNVCFRNTSPHADSTNPIAES